MAAALQSAGYGSGVLADLSSLAGAVEFWQAMRPAGLHPVLGCELPLRHVSGSGTVLLLAENDTGYQSLCRLITRCSTTAMPALEDLAGRVDGLLALSSGKDGLLHKLRKSGGPEAAGQFLGRLASVFGTDRTWVELFHQHPGDAVHCDRLATLADAAGLPVVAACEARYATPGEAPLLAAVASIGTLTLLDEPHSDKPAPASGFHLRPAEEFARIFSRWPHAIAETTAIAARCHLDILDAAT